MFISALFLQQSRHGSNINVYWQWIDEDMVHMYNGILISQEIEWNNAISNNMDGSRDYHIKSDKDKCPMTSFICGIWKKRYKWIYLTKQKQTHKHRKQTYISQKGKAGGIN